jgi:hypothetical protein
MKKLILLTILISCFGPAVEAQTCGGASPTWNCTSGQWASTTTLQNTINAASSGDTINLAAGTNAWTSGVSISTPVSIVGAGSGRIVAYATTPSALTLGSGTLSFTVTGTTQVVGTPPNTSALSTLGWSNGQTLRVSELGFRANFMQGTITSFNTSTGALVMNITSFGGTCGTSDSNMPSNCKRWIISTVPSTIITHNSTTATLFSLTESTSGNISISGIKIAAGTEGGTFLFFTRTSGGQAIIVHDCWFEVASGAYNGTGRLPIDGGTSRGLIYNTSIDNSPFSVVEDIRIKDPNNLFMPTSWTTVSTFGTNDTASTAFCSTCLAGQNNFYVESSDFYAGENLTNWDDNARSVFRYIFLDNAGMGSHGADTSNVGNRHNEIYNIFGVFNPYNDGSTANLNWWVHLRGGTMAFHDNVIPALVSTDYGTKSDLTLSVDNVDQNAGPHPCWGEGTTGGSQYWAPRQSGFGRVTGSGSTTGNQSSCPSPTNCSGNVFSGSTDAFTYVGDSEPIYSWNNARTSGGSFVVLNEVEGALIGGCTSPDNPSNYITSGRDFFNTTGTAKPSYTPYTYPHPLASGPLSSSSLSGVSIQGGSVH